MGFVSRARYTTIALGIIFTSSALIVADLLNAGDNSLWSVAFAGYDGPASASKSNSESNDAKPTEWHFVVSGDSRNCGDLIMPAIAQGAARDQAAFYWHLGDFRAIYEYDEDILSREAINFTDYQQSAWRDFIQMQIAPFDVLKVPVFLGIGNHETIKPMTREKYVEAFASWLDSPVLRSQRLADDPKALQPRTYYHWIKDGVDFINLDNASDDQFDTDQTKWFNKTLKQDDSDSNIHAIVVGMHKALPDSLSNSHSMSETAQGTYSGRCVYKSLAKAEEVFHKNVYVLASHSHFRMENIYGTDFWRAHSKTILPGWIIGTAGAIRYRLPENPPAGSQTDIYGYLLGTVNAGGKSGAIEFVFKAVDLNDIPVETRKLFSPELINFCFEQNKNNQKQSLIAEPPDGPCPDAD